MQAIKDKIFIKVLKQELLTKGGLIVPETIKREPQRYGIVISIGPDVKGIQIGETIMFHDRGGQVVTLNDEEYRVLMESEIYGVIKNQSSSGSNSVVA
jgi:chaperonin GroES